LWGIVGAGEREIANVKRHLLAAREIRPETGAKRET
jgi:hypothetical protein